MKKIISLLLVAVLLVTTLASCQGITKLRVNGVKIDNEIYTYFESTLKKDENGEVSEDAVKSAVSRYVTINSEFNNRGLAIDSDLKGDLSARVNDLWHLYGDYYTEIGVSKQTVYKIELSKEYESAILADYYSENGTSPVTEEELKSYFKENYIGIHFTTGYLFNADENGENVPMTDEQKNSVIASYNSVATLINEGTVIEEAVASLSEDADVHDALINAFSDGTFPQGFFAEVNKIETEKATTVVIGDYIFLVQRIDVFDSTYGYYDNNRTECLKRMKGEEFQGLVDEWSKNYTAE